MTNCRSCDAPIRWAKTATTKLTPDGNIVFNGGTYVEASGRRTPTVEVGFSRRARSKMSGRATRRTSVHLPERPPTRTEGERRRSLTHYRAAILATPVCVNPTASATARRVAPDATAARIASSRRARAARAASAALRAVWMGSVAKCLEGAIFLRVGLSVLLQHLHVVGEALGLRHVAGVAQTTEVLRVGRSATGPADLGVLADAAGRFVVLGCHAVTVNRVAKVVNQVSKDAS